MSRNASASAEMNLCQDSQPRAVNPPAAAPEPHAGEWPAGLDWHAIARRIFRAAVVAALGLFLVAAAFAQVNPYPDARALAPAHTADQPYGPPTTGSASSILLVPGTLNLVSGLNGQGYGGDGGLANASAVQFDFPSGVAYDSSGNLYIADGQNYIVRKIDHTTGDISTFAGTPQTEGFSLNGGTAIGAQLGTLYGLIIDSSDNLYVADVYNDVIWKITSAGAISVFAGGGTSPGSCTGSTNSIGDGCLATDATLSYPIGLAFDAAGNLYIADSHNFLVREVAAATGKISTFAGNVGDSYDSGCPTDLYTTSTGPWTPTQAHLCFPYGVGFDSNGNFYVVESQRYLVRVVTKSTGDISTFAGGGSGTCTGAVDTFGDGCPASDAILSYPQGLYVDPDNRVYFADQLGDEIRMVDTSGNISIVLGGNGELVKASIGKPDTEEVFVSGSPVGSANGIDFFTMDPYGDIVATDADSAAVTSAGSSGGYVFPSTPIFTTATTTSANAFSALFPPYILIINPSGVALSLGADPVITGPFGIVTGAGAGTCTFPGTVAPGESCTLVLSFTPTVGNNTTATGSIAISTNTGNSPNIIDLSGIGTGFATTSATVTPSLLTFTSTVNTASATQNATLTNTGQTAIAISSVGFTGEDPTNFAVSSTTCPAAGGAGTLGIGGACTYSIDFTPNSATTFSAGFQVCISTASYGCINSTTVNGTGTAAAPATATPVITPAAGTYNAPVEVEITDSDSSATIYYTTNGDVPTTTNSTVYSGPFQLPVPGAQVQTFATSTGNPNSAVASSTFTVQPFLDFSNAAVGVAPGSAQQLTARFSLLGNTAPTAAAHYGHDYTLGAVSCTPSGSIEVCTVPITFIPTLPGGRRDALFLTNGSTRAATSLLYGIGQAPMSEVQPGIVTSPITSFSGYIYNSVVDENGTVYFLATETSDVYSLTKGGTPTLLPITGLNSPRSIAIDGAGVLYISDQKYNASMTTWDTVQSIQGTVTLPIDSYWQFSNVDGIGDLFVNSSDNNSIYELKTDGTTTDTVIDPAITGANNSTVDAAGDLFIGGYTINELTPAGVQSQINTVGAGEGMGVDAADTVYATRYTGGGVAELPASSYTTALANLDASASPLGMSLGSDGTVWVGNYTNLDKVDRTQGAIAFGEQTAGTASAPMDISVYNSGNEDLTLSNIVLTGASSGFSIQTAASDNCTNGIVIAPGALCQVAVTLTAPHAGVFTGSITLTTNSLYNASTTQTVSLSGFVYGIYVTASPNPLNFPNQAINTTSSPMYVTLTNSGDLYDAGIGTPVASSSAYTVGLGTCTAAVAPGGTCQLSVTFDPSLAQAYDSAVTLSASSNGGGPNQTVTFGVTGTGTSPATPTATLTGIAFGNQTEGVTSGAMTATLANTSSGASLSITGITITGANAADFKVTTGTGACGTTLAESSSCPIYITFTPSTIAAESATLNVADNATGSPQTAPLTGTGVAAVPTATLTGISFGSETEGVTSAAMTATLTNTSSSASLSISGITITGTNAADFKVTTGTGACGSSLAAAKSCPINITFTPSTAAAESATLNVADNATGSPQTAPLTGTGVAAVPTATLTGISFGSETEGVTSAAMTATLTNTSSSASLSISGITITGTNAADFKVTTGTGGCGSSLAAGKSCPIYATFTPSTAAAESATLQVADNATGSPQTAPLTGTGTPPLIANASVSPTSLAFGNQQVNTTSAAMNVTLSSTGTATLDISSIYLNEPSEDDGAVPGRRLPLAVGGSGHPAQLTITSSPDYSATTTCGSTLAAGATCTISVTFDPSTTGSLPGTLGVEDNASNSPQTVSLSGTGVTGGSFTVASPTPPQTVKAGASAQYIVNVAVTPNGDIFPNEVTLTASGLPPGATASFSPPQVVPGTGTVTSNMTVQTSTQTSLLAPAGRGWPAVPSSLALAGIGVLISFRRKHRERLARYFALVLLLASLGAATFGLMGCGAGFAQIQPKTYTITVTGTSGAASASTTVQLTVE